MKKKILSIVVILIIATISFGQDSRGYIGFSFGPSFPLGEFASKDLDTEDAGYATTGFLFDISFAYKLGDGKFGFTALLRAQANPTDVQAMADKLAELVPGVFWTVEGQAWGTAGFLFGGFAPFPLSEKTKLEIKGMIGFLSASSPELTITGSGGGESIWIKQSSGNASSFAYLIGAGFKFDLSRRLYLLTNLDYLGAKPEFSDIEITASDGSSETDTRSQSMGTFNLSAGIALKF